MPKNHCLTNAKHFEKALSSTELAIARFVGEEYGEGAFVVPIV